MSRSHNIVGCEALADPDRRLVAFSHAHGSILMLAPRPARRPLHTLLTFAAGAALALAAAALFARP